MELPREPPISVDNLLWLGVNRDLEELVIVRIYRHTPGGTEAALNGRARDRLFAGIIRWHH